MEERNLDGYYFRVQRDGRWVNRCFTDMTLAEQLGAIMGKSDAWLRNFLTGLHEVYAELCKLVGEQVVDLGFVSETTPSATLVPMILTVATNIRIIGLMHDLSRE